MQQDVKRTLISGIYGNALEWYDFLLFAYFAPVFASIFFPLQNTLSSLLATFTVFASGFIVRPIGAICLGHIADKVGRRKALIASILIMTLTTLLIACLPTYQQIGVLAPILLTILRLVQGFAISGELNSSVAYVTEHAAPNHRGAAAGSVMCSAILGILLGAITAVIVTGLVTQDQLHTWGWRIPYLIAGVLGFLGIYLRIRCEESPRFLAIEKEITHFPLKVLMKDYRKELIVGIALTSVMAIGNYLVIAYFTTFLVSVKGTLSMNHAIQVNLIAMTVFLFLLPIAGYISDKLGRKPVFMFGLICMLLASFPIFWLLNIGSFYSALSAQLLLVFSLAPIGGIIPIILAEKFPTSVRGSGSAIAYNISLAIFGGTAPAVSLELVRITGNNIAPAGYLFICSLIALVAWFFIKDRHKEVLI